MDFIGQDRRSRLFGLAEIFLMIMAVGLSFTRIRILRTDISGYSLAQMSLLMAMAVLLYIRFKWPDLMKIPAVIRRPLMGILFFGLITALCGREPLWSLDMIRRTVKEMLALLVVYTVLRRRRIEPFAIILCTAAGFVYTGGVIQKFTGSFMGFQPMIGGRIGSLFGYANILGLYIYMTLPLCIALAIRAWTRKTGGLTMLWCRISMPVFAVLGILSMIFSRSRASWLALGAAAVFFIIRLPLKKIRFGLAVGLIVSAAISAPLWIPRATTIFDRTYSSNLERLHLWTPAARALAREPVEGFGRFSYPERIFAHPDAFVHLPHPHNMYFHLAIAFGIPVAVWYLFLVWHAGMGNLHRKNGIEIVLLALQATAAGTVVYGFLDNLFFIGQASMLSWMILGAALTAYGRKSGLYIEKSG